MKGSHTTATCSTPGNPQPCPLCSSVPHLPQQPLTATSPRKERFRTSPNKPGTRLRSQGDASSSLLVLGQRFPCHSPGRQDPKGTLVSDGLSMLRDSEEGQSQDHQNSEEETCGQGDCGRVGVLDVGTQRRA